MEEKILRGAYGEIMEEEFREQLGMTAYNYTRPLA